MTLTARHRTTYGGSAENRGLFRSLHQECTEAHILNWAMILSMPTQQLLDIRREGVHRNTVPVLLDGQATSGEDLVVVAPGGLAHVDGLVPIELAEELSTHSQGAGA